MASAATATARESVADALIGMQRIRNIVEVAFHTAAITGSIPISVLLVGGAGTGKSKLLLSYEGDSIYRADDLTASGLIDILTTDPENKIKHILIGDFNTVMSHKTGVTSLLVGTLLSVMSDGIASITDGRAKKDIVHDTTGIVSAMTPEVFQRIAHKWEGLGLKRRFLTIYYAYSTETIIAINKSIERGETGLAPHPKRTISIPAASDIVIPDKEAAEISLYSNHLATNMSFRPEWERDAATWKLSVVAKKGEMPMTFTPHLILRSMAKASAVRNKRKVVNSKDLAFLRELLNFTNYATPVLL